MKTINDELIKFLEDILEFSLPRWDELPDIELYMDQVITFIDKNVSIFPAIDTKGIITPSMVNNYVKLNLIPKPVKRKYSKLHLAYLIAISILKHVYTIQEVRDGISFQAMIHGEKDAYNLFCREQELALKSLAKHILSGDNTSLDNLSIEAENLVIKMSTLAFASKVIGEKTIGIQKDFMDNEKSNNII